MKTLFNCMDESKASMCLSPPEKLKSAAAQRPKRSHAGTGSTDVKKARLDDRLPSDVDTIHLDGWISDDYLRAMDFDDRLSQDIDWVAHDEMDLALSMDALTPDHAEHDDVTDFSLIPSCLRGGLAFEDPAEMTSTFGDSVYTGTELSRTKDAETLLMSFDTMKFKIPSPTSAASKSRSSIFAAKPLELEPTVQSTAKAAVFTSAATLAAEEDGKEPARTASRSNSATASSPLRVHAVDAPTSSSTSSDKKIGSYSPAARKVRLLKFHAKRKSRTWKKSIKYDCRKKLADDRPRIKGRFVRVHENASAEPATPLTSMAGYASPKSPTNLLVSPAMAPAAKAPGPRVAGATLSLSVKQPPAASVAEAASSSATPLSFARMIASV